MSQLHGHVKEEEEFIMYRGGSRNKEEGGGGGGRAPYFVKVVAVPSVAPVLHQKQSKLCPPKYNYYNEYNIIYPI